MALIICEVSWLTHLLTDLGLSSLAPVTLKCDDQAALAIVMNPVHNKKTKHVEVDCHYVRDKVNQGCIKPVYVSTHHQLADILTKSILVQIPDHYVQVGSSFFSLTA